MSKEFIVLFAEYLKTNGKSQSTIIAYTKDLEQLANYGGKGFDTLTTADINKALEAMQKEHGLTPKTVSRKINSFRTFYKYLNGLGEMQENPAVSLTHPKVTNIPARILTNTEILALREVSRDNIRLYTMIELMLQTGLRIGEVSRLNRGDVVLTGSNPHITIIEFSTIIGREIPLNSKAKDSLEVYLQKLNITEPEAPLFATRDGKHIIIRNIRSSIDRALVKAQIKGACVNDLRNTFIVAQLKAGVALDTIALCVGHRSRNTTNKYQELLEEGYHPTGKTQLVEV